MARGVPATEYHERTKHTPRSVREGGHRLDFDNKPIPYKIYEERPFVSLPEAPPVERQALRAVADVGGLPTPAAGPADGGERTPGDHEDRVTHGREAVPGLADVAALCYYAAGVTKTIRRGRREVDFRAAACTGALYHVDLYLVCGDLPGLNPGVYHYDPRTDALDVLREGDYRGVLAEATAAHPDVGAAPLSVVATSTWWRNAWKYEARTYRHAFWDAGTVLANLLAVAGGRDLPASVVTGFVDERVADLLGVETAEEGPLAVVPVGRDGLDSTDTVDAIEPIDPATRRLSPDPKRYGLISEAYAASSLSDPAAVREWREGAVDDEDGVGRRDPGDGPRVPLDPVGDDRASKVPLDAAVERRGSCREYARDPLNRRKVSTVLDRATRAPPMDVRPAEGSRLGFVDPYVVVHDVEDVPSGTYHYHPGTGDLERLEAGDFRRRAGHLALDQALAADAGLDVYFMTDLDAVTGTLGDRGYRAAQLEAAVAAGLLYLAAYAHRDLGATGLTFYDDLVTEFLAPRAAGQTPMFLWTLGRPA